MCLDKKEKIKNSQDQKDEKMHPKSLETVNIGLFGISGLNQFNRQNYTSNSTQI